MTDYYVRFLTLVDEIERTFPVAHWQVGGVPVWPLARDGLLVDLYRQAYGELAGDKPPNQKRHLIPLIKEASSLAATPISNLWRRRTDLRHVRLVPHSADALFLGEGFSFEWIGGAWRDRFFEPIIAELQRTSRSTFVMQRGHVCRLPSSRPIFDANTIDNWGRLYASLSGISNRLMSALPAHQSVAQFLDGWGLPTRSIDPRFLLEKAALVQATANGFDRVLSIVRPSVCFMVTMMAGGYGLAMACRRRGILSVEIQRGGLGARAAENNWSVPPENGYAILPAVTWAWTEEASDSINQWTRKLKAPWHRSIYGGHPQLPAWLDDHNPETRSSDAQIMTLRSAHPARLEILVALQNHDGYLELFNDIAALIERAPKDWRWWLRRHPYTPYADKEFGRLLTIRQPNVLIDEASSRPLPALLRHVDAFISVRSGSACEASMFGLRPIFLSPIARNMFPQLFASSAEAEIIDNVTALEERLRSLRRTPKTCTPQPELRAVLSQLDAIALEYSALCGAQSSVRRREPTPADD